MVKIEKAKESIHMVVNLRESIPRKKKKKY